MSTNLRHGIVSVVLSLTALSFVSCDGPTATTPSTPTPTQPPASTSPQQPTSTPGSPTVDWAADGVVEPGEYSNELVQGTYRLFWSSSEETIRIAMQADTGGWVAVGFQPGDRMKNADIVMGMMVDGQAVVSDHYSTGDFGPHSADVNQGGSDDVLSFGGLRTDSSTTFEFERSLDTGDEYDESLERGVATQIIWAYGSSDNERMQHSARGYASITP
ncbi:MAG: hypothetical protein JXA58_00805 [Dehalococcoidia bacterium]|nr:hypothetical protein [Dehalococcoidia bacterium]